MKIVVVEDEKPIREGLVKILEKMNKEYVVTGSASNGRKGLELIRKVHPDLIFLDIQMPEMDGLELLHTIREEGIDARVIILTAYSDFKYAKVLCKGLNDGEELERSIRDWETDTKIICVPFRRM